MEEQIYEVTSEEVQQFKKRGYSDDLLPKTKEKRNMKTANYFTLWMGSVHNIPNYAAVGGFLFLGLSPLNIIVAIIISSIVVSLFMSVNGLAGSKYGIPFAIHLRSIYGNIGAKLPGFLRGCIAAIAWFGLQTYTGSIALLILIGKIWPEFLTIGGSTSILGLSVPGFITFTLFWLLNVLIGIGGGAILNRFTAILSPLIYLIFGGMMVWALSKSGGIGNILSYQVEATRSVHPLFVYFIIINSVLSVWAAPGSSVSDFTQNAVSSKAQMIGQSTSLITSYLIFAFSSVTILIGGSIYYGAPEWDVLNIVNKWDSLPAVVLATGVLLLTTISTNATGNIVPAAYQLCALFPKKIDYKKGVLIAAVISFMIMPWKLMENQESIFIFLNLIGAILGPVAGVMIAHYFFIAKQKINLDALYMNLNGNNSRNQYYGINWQAYIATLIGFICSLSGKFATDVSWLVGFSFALSSYLVIKKIKRKKQLKQ